MISVVPDNLAAGLNVKEIINSYPSLTPEAIQAAMAYVAELARERVVALPAWMMKFKIDENLPVEVAEVLRQAGYEAATVHDQNLAGEIDCTLALVCQSEQRALITIFTWDTE